MWNATIVAYLMYSPTTSPRGTTTPRKVPVRKPDLQADHGIRDLSNVKHLLTKQLHTTPVEEFSSRSRTAKLPVA
jgi:hypothetical protein